MKSYYKSVTEIVFVKDVIIGLKMMQKKKLF